VTETPPPDGSDADTAGTRAGAAAPVSAPPAAATPVADAEPPTATAPVGSPPPAPPPGRATRLRRTVAGWRAGFWRRFPAGVGEARARRHWGELGSEVVERFVAPLFHPTFVLYLLSGVILLGGVPVALEWVRYLLAQHALESAVAARVSATDLPALPSFEPVLTALHTFYPALAWSSAMQINFAEAKTDDRARKSLRALAFVLATVTLLMSILLNAARPLFTEDGSLRFGLLGVLMAVVLWWLANAREQTFLEPLSGDAPLGGDADGPAEELSGGVEGFAT